MSRDYTRSLAEAQKLRALGLVVLPSRMDAKRPVLTDYARYRQEPTPDSMYTESNWHTTNLQVMCGRETSGELKIVVVDLDGEMAVDAWTKICRLRNYKFPGSWIADTASGGMHVYYTLPPGAGKVPTRPIWGLWDTAGGPLGKGSWVTHKEVRIIGDGGLAIAPPSRHVIDGMGHYGWRGKYGPHTYRVPAPCPEWLLAMPSITAAPHSYQQPARQNPNSSHCGDTPRDKVLSQVTPAEKVRLAKSWGLRIVGQSGSTLKCRSIDREDTNPSATFDPNTGVYRDFTTQTRLSFFDLGIALGAFKSFVDALNSLRRQTPA